MKLIRVAVMLLAAAAIGIGVGKASAQTPNPKINVSMNVLPMTPGNPNGGGTWTIVAKTDSPHGISAISFWISRINTAGIVAESDIGNVANAGHPYNGTFGGIHNLVYGQNTANPPSVVVGVGTPLRSDGPDPLGNPFWDGATRLMSGSYSSLLPLFSTTAGSISGGNTLSTSTPPFNFAMAADLVTVVRVIPEPATASLAVGALFGLLALRRRR